MVTLNGILYLGGVVLGIAGLYYCNASNERLSETYYVSIDVFYTTIICKGCTICIAM